MIHSVDLDVDIAARFYYTSFNVSISSPYFMGGVSRLVSFVLDFFL